MARVSVKRSQLEIDPMFNIPEGMEDLIYSDDETIDESEAEWTINIDDDGEYPDEDIPPPPDAPASPDILSVISPQIFRTTAAGNQVVDVTFEVEDIEGVLQYELRLVRR